MVDLKPANTNPWYVLMTLYGEAGDEGKYDAGETHDLNRWAWNSWALQDITAVELAQAGIEIGEAENCLNSWEKDKAETLKKFQEVYAERNLLSGADAALPVPSDYVDLSQTEFEKPLNLDGFIIPRGVRQNRINITSGLILTGSQFSQWFSCDNLVCIGPLRAGNCEFQGNVIFDNCRAHGRLVLSNSKFFGDATFEGFTCYDMVYFDQATFKERPYFVFANFCKGVNFAGVTFGAGAVFRAARFFGNAEFSTSTFGKSADFSEALFKLGKDKNGRVRFVGVKFGGPIAFENTRFIDRFPVFDGSELPSLSTFTADPAFWPQEVIDAVEAKRAFATIRHATAKQGQPDDEHFFFRGEMEFSRCIILSMSDGQSPHFRSFFCFQAWPYWAYKTFSGYGESIAKPVRALCEVFFLGFAAFAGYLLPTLGSLKALGLACALSFSNLLPLFGFGRMYLGDVLGALPWGLQVMGAAQTVFALPLLFFLGLGLRKRFRLR